MRFASVKVLAGEGLFPAEISRLELLTVPATVSTVRMLPGRKAALLAKLPDTLKVTTSAVAAEPAAKTNAMAAVKTAATILDFMPFTPTPLFSHGLY